ncbi:MAG TPA: TonB-dependent receptor [Parafilimonas sp.]|nr:TonB-dependent receptor [Parafilimonas sp.]
MPGVSFAQQKISGSVKSSSTNEPLAGASVTGSGGANAVTDNAGNFNITTAAGDVLHITYVGYAALDYTVKENESFIALALQPSTDQLSDVVVVGYGTQKKVNLTGAVASISDKQLANRPVTSVGNALQGTMAGVTVTAANSGQPGADGSTIRIRGIGTLNNANPAVVIDGVITTMSNLNNINPDDIASISVLKDAASAAIYGSRAANGVILVTTKMGKKGTSQITYSGYVGKQSANGLPDFLPSWQAATLYNQALSNEGRTLRWTDDDIQKFKDGSDPYGHPNTDWLGLFYNGSGIQQNHFLGLSGGNDKTQYSLSLGLYDQDGLVEETNAKRYTARYNVQSQVSDKLAVTGNLAFTYSSQQQPTNPYTGDFTQLVRQINRISPTIPYKFENGHYGYIADGSPMAWLEGNSEQNADYYDLLGNIAANWEPVKNLHIRPSISYVMKASHNKNFIADQQYYDADGNETFYQGPNSVKDANSFMNTVTMQALADYSKSYGNHNFKILGGYSQEYNKYTFDDGYRKNFLNNLLTDVNLGSTDGQTTSGYSYELALQSYFGRINYDYAGKYLLEANLRYDGSSRFAPDNRWGVFPSFSAGWNIDREDFFQDLKPTISSLKLRGSWGQLGNQTLNSSLSVDQQYYPYVSLVAGGQNYIFGGPNPVIAAGISPVDGSNEDIKWETTRETDIGFDAGFLQNKITLTVDYFDKLTDGILLSVPVGAPYGLTAPVQNAAKISNKGWEFTVGYNGGGKEFTYNINANVSFINNEVKDLSGTGPIISGYTYYDKGLPFYSLYGYKADGIFQSADEVAKASYQSNRTAAGDLRYVDIDGNDTINSADRTYLGTYFPKTTFGLTFTGQWKGFDISVFLQGAAGVKNYTDGGKLGYVSSSAGKPTSAMLDTWTPENTGASMPRIWYSYTQNDPTSTPSSFWVKDGSYVRLKNLQVGYTLPANTLKKIGINKVRIYYSGQNLLTFDNLDKWVDPESPIRSSIYYYPQVKVNTIGLNVTF